MEDELPFYMCLEDIEYSTLKRCAQQLNQTTDRKKMVRAMKEVMLIVHKYLEEEDFYPLFHVLNYDDKPEELVRLVEWYWIDHDEDDQSEKILFPEYTGDGEGQLIEFFETNVVQPPDLLPEAVTLIIQLGAVSDEASCEEVLMTYIEKLNTEDK